MYCRWLRNYCRQVQFILLKTPDTQKNYHKQKYSRSQWDNMNYVISKNFLNHVSNVLKYSCKCSILMAEIFNNLHCSSWIIGENSVQFSVNYDTDFRKIKSVTLCLKFRCIITFTTMLVIFIGYYWNWHDWIPMLQIWNVLKLVQQHLLKEIDPR